MEDTTVKLWVKKQNRWEIFHELNHSNEPTCVIWSPVVGKQLNKNSILLTLY